MDQFSLKIGGSSLLHKEVLSFTLALREGDLVEADANQVFLFLFPCSHLTNPPESGGGGFSFLSGKQRLLHSGILKSIIPVTKFIVILFLITQ